MALTTKKVATGKKVARPRAMPLPPPSILPDVLPPLPLSTIDLLEVGAEPELSWPPAEKKPSAVLAKATSKLGKKSTKLKSAAPWKLVRPKPRRDSWPPD
jgi:hypothetical protein